MLNLWNMRDALTELWLLEGKSTAQQMDAMRGGDRKANDVAVASRPMKDASVAFRAAQA